MINQEEEFNKIKEQLIKEEQETIEEYNSLVRRLGIEIDEYNAGDETRLININKTLDEIHEMTHRSRDMMEIQEEDMREVAQMLAEEDWE